MMKLTVLPLLFALCVTETFSAHSQSIKPRSVKQSSVKPLSDQSSWYFKPIFTKGQRLGNIYSRTIAYSGEGFTDLIQRVSGSSTYTVLDPDPLKPVFDETDLYDGRPASTGKSVIRLSGKGSYDGKEFVNTSASGLMYSELVWGTLPVKVQEGDSWKINIAQPWELGGPGSQTVTVIQLDHRNHTIMLKREGDSEGFYDGDAKQLPITTKDGKNLKVNIVPGTSHWTGFTIFKNGIVSADELLVTRPITLTTDSLQLKGRQREYILLNAMPVD